MSKPTKYPIVLFDEEYVAVTIRYKNGTVETRTRACDTDVDLKLVGEDLYQQSIIMGYDPEAKRLLKLKNHLKLKGLLLEIAELLTVTANGI